MSPRFETRLAQSPEEIAAAQRLRYSVFVEELLGNGSMVDHAAKLEKDAFDEHAHHLLLFDHARENDVPNNNIAKLSIILGHFWSVLIVSFLKKEAYKDLRKYFFMTLTLLSILGHSF